MFTSSNRELLFNVADDPSESVDLYEANIALARRLNTDSKLILMQLAQKDQRKVIAGKAVVWVQLRRSFSLDIQNDGKTTLPPNERPRRKSGSLAAITGNRPTNKPCASTIASRSILAYHTKKISLASKSAQCHY